MSQVGGFSDNSPGSIDIVSITPDTGTTPVVPTAGGNVTIIGGVTSEFSDDGIRTLGGTNELTIQLTNAIRGQISTSNATPTAIITFSLGSTAAVYSFAGVVTCKSSTGDGCTYFLQSCIKTNGTSSTEVGTEDSIFFEDTSLSTCDAVVSASGNNFVVTVNGVLATAINWDASFQFRRVI